MARRRGTARKAVSGSGAYIVRSAEGNRSSVSKSRLSKTARDRSYVIGSLRNGQKKR